MTILHCSSRCLKWLNLVLCGSFPFFASMQNVFSTYICLRVWFRGIKLSGLVWRLMYMSSLLSGKGQSPIEGSYVIAIVASLVSYFPSALISHTWLLDILSTLYCQTCLHWWIVQLARFIQLSIETLDWTELCLILIWKRSVIM